LHSFGMFATVLVFAVVVTAVGGWVLFKAMNSVGKSAHDPKHARRSLIVLSVFYVVNALYIFSEIIRGEEPPLALIGLPVVILYMWYLWRSMNRRVRIADLAAEKEKGPEA
jgi:cytochrome bd-type quinol oxidase subunit 2